MTVFIESHEIPFFNFADVLMQHVIVDIIPLELPFPLWVGLLQNILCDPSLLFIFLC